MSKHFVNIEVAGPAAMFSRPDTGATPVSYPVPTASAVKGMFEAVLRKPHIYIQPTLVEICKPIRFERYITNYGGPLRKGKDIKEKNTYQFLATIIVDVHFRIYAEVHMKMMSTRSKEVQQLRRRRGRDWRPQFKKLFADRLEHGQFFYTPCLGWKEFIPSYFGPIRTQDEHGQKIDPVATGEIHIPAMLTSMWDHHDYRPCFEERWIVDGIMSYTHERPPKEVLNVE
ncbi:MAG: CRISPR-associated protein Cas5 [Deltaproteobacteria bacterium]|nr:CRISPR-associated protein Cas5 [Deltaproteobacteria bacterium]MDX9762378.1 CRISPR-associated protein Cas5 [Desulfomonilia bacterium]